MAIENKTPKRFTAVNESTGALIKSRPDNQDVFAEGWERIFGNKKKEEETIEQRSGSEDQQ